jgi:hypothetical protein
MKKVFIMLAFAGLVGSISASVNFDDKDKKAKKLMDQLLNKIPEIRLEGSYSALKANP